MRRLIFLLTLLAGSFLVNLLQSTPALATNKQVVRVASIDWCPQLCPDREQGGYVYDLLALIFKDTEYTLVIETMPWSRAIRLTREGVTPILLAPARAEAPDLRYPNIPVGTQSMCFFTQASSSWTFQGALSLRGLNIGIANDTSIEELNDYVAANPGQFQFQPYSDQYIVSNLRKLERGRIDAFLFTKNTTRYEIDKIGWGDKFRVAGCVSKADIFIAFSPEPSVERTVDPLIRLVEEKLAQLYADGTVAKVMAQYGLAD